MYSYEYPRPAVTADIVVFNQDQSQVLLIRRGGEPFKDCWAFPGGFFDMADRDIEHTAARELQEETGLADIPLQLVGVFSKEGRDPRGRTITIAFSAHINPTTVNPVGGDDAREARWFPVAQLPPLAFDHEEILQAATNKR